ncbi:MAG: VOC family protein [Halioglobus sp.]
MNDLTISSLAKAVFLVALAGLAACTAGEVRDTSGTVIPDVNVTAYGECAGAGCAANEVATPIPGGSLTGYQATTNGNGQYFYDPYAETVDHENAMAINIPAESAQSFYKLKYSQPGYQDTWLDYTPNFKSYLHNGKTYVITEVPDVFLCADGATDSDGDSICDNAEVRYGTDPLSTDTDRDGEYDDQEIFGTGSPFASNLRSLLHYNINVSDFQASKSFYEMLGFRALLEIDVDVSDPAEAQGLNLPPYSLKAAPMGLGDGFIIDLIQFYSPYDPEAPHSDIYSLGLATLSLKTDDLPADIAVLETRGIPYDLLLENSAGPVVIQFSDPDGAIILLTQVFENKGLNSSGETSVHGVFSTNINVSDYERALAFYQKVGFRLIGEQNGIARIALQDGRHITLTPSGSSDAAYQDVNHLGIARIAIETTNIDQDIKVLEENGIAFYTPEAIVPSGPLSILRYVCFEDPDGTVIELVQYNN